MQRKTPFVEGETYHIFNRGAHKQEVFTNKEDYRRFLLLLFLANDSNPLNLRDLFTRYKGRSFVEIFENEKPDKSLVNTFAYCLMPNHFHLVLQQKKEMGITTFARKVLTGYSMYFNTKHEHSGVLFQGRYKDRHVDTEAYFRYIFSYIHLNPLPPGLMLSREEGAIIGDLKAAHSFLQEYPYSSFYDYVSPLGKTRPERNILCLEEAPDFLRNHDQVEELIMWGERFTKDRPL